MGDASVSQPMPQQDPNMMSTPDQNIDPNMGAEDPNMMGGGDQSMNLDPTVGADEPSMGSDEKTKKDIQKNIGKACDDFRNYQGQDKEELGKWVSGMLDSLDGEDDENADPTDDPDSIEQEPVDMGQQMPMESVFFKKKNLNEVFGVDDEQKDEPKPEQKKSKVNNTPFNNPNNGK